MHFLKLEILVHNVGSRWFLHFLFYFLYIYIYICVCMCVWVYMYIYIFVVCFFLQVVMKGCIKCIVLFDNKRKKKKHARSRLISEAKQGRAWLVLGWETAWEYQVL